MNINPNHLLSKLGILISFNIARKIKPSQINSIEKKLLKSGLSKKEIDEQLNKKLIEKNEKYFNIYDIPGIINVNSHPKIEIDPIIQNHIIESSHISVKFFKKNKFTKEHVIFFIQAILHLYGISNKDVDRFKKKYNIDQEGSTDYLNDDEDDYSDEDEE